MPIWKFRTLEDADTPFICLRPDKAYYQRLAELWRFANQLAPRRCRRGVFKFRTIEEKNAADEQWEVEDALALRAQRQVAASSRQDGHEDQE